MIINMNIWQETVQVRVADVDKTEQLMVSAAFDMFQNTAVKHAEDLHLGKIDMEKSGLTWVLSRISVFIERRPIFKDHVTIKTWPRGSQKIFAVRDYDMLDANGKSIARGRSGWLIVDLNIRRPQRPEAIVSQIPQNEGLNALDYSFESLDSPTDLTKFGERRAAYTDIDYAGHVNNARYVQWIQDIMEPELLYNARQFRLDINYLSEILPGDNVELWSGQAGRPQTIAVEGRKIIDGQAAFRSELWLGN